MSYPPDPYRPPDPYQPVDPYRPVDPYQPSPPPPDPTMSYQPGTYGDPGVIPPAPYGGGGYDPPPHGYPPPPPDKSPFGAPGYGAPYGPAQNTNVLAIASLVCSLLGIVVCVSAPAGVVLGHLAKKQIRQTREVGEGLAVAGLWVGYLVTVAYVLITVFYAVGFFWVVTRGTTLTS